MVPEDGERLLELVLLDVAVCGKVATSRASGDEVFAGEEGQGAGVVVVREMNLC